MAINDYLLAPIWSIVTSGCECNACFKKVSPEEQEKLKLSAALLFRMQCLCSTFGSLSTNKSDGQRHHCVQNAYSRTLRCVVSRLDLSEHIQLKKRCKFL